MLLPGTQMHIVTFTFVCIEIVILFYLIIYKLARPDVKTTALNIWLVSLLLIYNITGGLLPDPNLPGSVFIQEVIAYATGFITPSYFPYYVLKAFNLEKMRFHAYRGVFMCLIFPYFLFVLVYAITNDLRSAQDLLILPVLYAIWVIVSLAKALRYKYNNDFSSKESKEETIVLFVSLTPWVGLPIIDFFNLGQCLEASVTNTGFLLLLALQLKNTVTQLRKEHRRLIDSEIRLLGWNTDLQKEVEKRTKELEKFADQKINAFVNLAHETKTPLTLIKNYLEEYVSKTPISPELTIVKRSIDKLTTDIINLFDLERFNRGLSVYNHSLVTSFSEILTDNLVLFQAYAASKGIHLETKIQENVLLKADPLAINRIINNLVENAIKFSEAGHPIKINLSSTFDRIEFSVIDNGIGIPTQLHKKVFEPYYQINQKKQSSQGMGLGLPIVQKVVESLYGSVSVVSNPQKSKGTAISVFLPRHTLQKSETIATYKVNDVALKDVEIMTSKKIVHDNTKQTILVVEDNPAMTNYLVLKLNEHYNVYSSPGGSDALHVIKSDKVIPDLIISDIMMDKMDGFALAKIIMHDTSLNHIPILFLSAITSKAEKFHGLDLGAVDFIHKPFSIQELIKKISSILLIANNQKKAIANSAFRAISTVDNRTINTQVSFENKFESSCQLYNLTTREKTIARLICEGLKYKEIGDQLFIAERTVTKHAQNIFEKVQVSNKIDLAKRLTG